MKTNTPHFVCQICGISKRAVEMIPAELVRETIAAQIRLTHPNWSVNGYICRSDLNQFRASYIQSLIEREKGELSIIERDVLNSLNQRELLATNVDEDFQKNRTVGDMWSDRIASFGGSWRFIFLFFGFMLLWMIINSAALITHAFDPYPYIFLNLVLSCVAAVQAPIIMMSQNRQEARDRMRSENDYKVNLKAELEIRQLHEKIDHLLSNQWERLVEIQQIQIELMDEMVKRRP
ncbi:MAG: DUF1003 domain-containing protein [Rhodospirillales bacterium]|nr:DUF1003 domain-containing protein [Rhodospirillales bacterium]